MHNDCRDIVMFKENPVFLCFSLCKYSFVSLQTIQTSIENPAGSPCTFLYKSTILRIFTSYNFRIVIQINLQRSILYNEVLCTTPCGIEYCTGITFLFQIDKVTKRSAQRLSGIRTSSEVKSSLQHYQVKISFFLLFIHGML